MSPKINQGGRSTASKGKKVEKSVSTPILNFSGGQTSTLKVPSRFSRGDAVDKHSSSRGSSENPRSDFKRNRRVTVSLPPNPAQGKGNVFHSSEKRAKQNASKPRKSVSPDLLDLTNEDVVKGLLLRLYDSLGIEECPEDAEESWSSASAGTVHKDEQTKFCTRKPAICNTTQGVKVDTTLRRRLSSLPQLIYPNMTCDVFYTPPASSPALRPVPRVKPRPSALALSPVESLSDGRESFSSLFPTLSSTGSPASTGRISVSPEANAKSGVEIPVIVKQGSFVQGRTPRSLFSRKSRSECYSVTFA